MMRYLPAAFLLFGMSVAIQAAEPPSKILDLSRWKLTLPYAEEGASRPLEVAPPKLVEFQDPRCFFVNKTGDGVVFRAHCTKVSLKAGCYTQSNADKGDTPESYGEVVIYDLQVAHDRPPEAGEEPEPGKRREGEGAK